jgi:hypothetical protein
MVEKHGGHIWLESQLDVGTVFHFTLPLRTDANDGHDDALDYGLSMGEGNEAREPRFAALASEETDSVDDDIQETREYTSVDTSSGDEL